MFRRTGFSTAPPPPPIPADSLSPKKKAAAPIEVKSVAQLLKMLNNGEQQRVLEMAMSNNQAQLDNVEFRQSDLEYRYKLMNLHIMNFSDKFALTIACFVLFFVAAPLGAFIRKGGIGLPLVFAMILFLILLFYRNVYEEHSREQHYQPRFSSVDSGLDINAFRHLSHRKNCQRQRSFPLPSHT